METPRYFIQIAEDEQLLTIDRGMIVTNRRTNIKSTKISVRQLPMNLTVLATADPTVQLFGYKLTTNWALDFLDPTAYSFVMLF